jgi:hypothetical protein
MGYGREGLKDKCVIVPKTEEPAMILGRRSFEFILIKRQGLIEPVNPVLPCKCRKLLFPMVSEAW